MFAVQGIRHADWTGESDKQAKRYAKRSETRGLMTTDLLLDLQLVYYRSQLRQDLVCLLMVFKLCGDEVREVAEGFGGIKDLGSQLASILITL